MTIDLNEERRKRREKAHAAKEAAQRSDEDKLALEFVDTYGGDLLHIAVWGKWCGWLLARWKPENTLAVFDSVRKFHRGKDDPK